MPDNKKNTVAVIGAGFAGLSAAAVLGATGKKVVLYEKNHDTGGRARVFSNQGFTFDMGPSWYWMPDVYERYYNLFGYTADDFYALKKLDPGFKVIFGKDESIDIPASYEELCSLFEGIEKGSADKLRKYMAQAAYKYDWGINKLVYQPGLSITEFLNFKLIKDMLKLQVFTSLSSHASQYFKDPRLLAIIEFPVLFLGARPKDTPALYSLMNHAELQQGTFYPMGGFGKVADAFRLIAEKNGVEIKTDEPVNSLELKSGKVSHVHSIHGSMQVDAVMGAADYHHIESKLLPADMRGYDEAYWDKKTFAPSCLLFYIGVNKKIDKLVHHNLFFDEDLNAHADEIYVSKKWPAKPLFYVCCPSKTDASVAPEGSENLFLLMPVAIGLNDAEDTKEHYFNIMMDRLEAFAGEPIRPNIVYKKNYSVNDFENDYNAYKGNAYGLANTLMQTAIFKPKIRSKKVSNLFFAGQLTVPGPGVPPAIISGQVSAKQLLKYLKK